MMRKQKDLPHSQPPTVFLCRGVNTACGELSREQFPAARLTDRPTTLVERSSTYPNNSCRDYARCHADERAPADLVHQNSSSVSVAYSGASSCMEIYRGGRRKSAKPSVTIVSRPTYLSVTCFPTSRSGFFGLQIQHPGSLRRLAAACAKLSDISVVMNGLAMLSPRSWPKSSNVAACATSRSFPNGSRRPF